MIALVLFAAGLYFKVYSYVPVAKVLKATEFNYKVLFWAVLLLVIAGTESVLLFTSIWFLTKSANQRRAALVVAAVLPFAGLIWIATIFEFQAVINKVFLERDPLISEICQCPLPDGYALFMCDVVDYGMIYKPKKNESPSVGRMQWTNSSGKLETTIDGAENVRNLQLADPYIFGSSDSKAPDRRFEKDRDKVDRFFLLNTKNDEQTEFATFAALQREALKLGVHLNLKPIIEVYRQHRFTPFDALAAILLILPPMVAFGRYLTWILRLKQEKSCRAAG